MAAIPICQDYPFGVTSLTCNTYAGGYYSCYYTPSKPTSNQKKNPFLLAGYIPALMLTIGHPQKKKESFKKASQIVISRVGIIESV